MCRCFRSARPFKRQLGQLDWREGARRNCWKATSRRKPWGRPASLKPQDTKCRPAPCALRPCEGSGGTPKPALCALRPKVDRSGKAHTTLRVLESWSKGPKVRGNQALRPCEGKGPWIDLKERRRQILILRIRKLQDSEGAIANLQKTWTRDFYCAFKFRRSGKGRENSVRHRYSSSLSCHGTWKVDKSRFFKSRFI